MTPRCAVFNQVLRAASADAGVRACRVANEMQHATSANTDEYRNPCR